MVGLHPLCAPSSSPFPAAAPDTYRFCRARCAQHRRQRLAAPWRSPPPHTWQNFAHCARHARQVFRILLPYHSHFYHRTLPSRAASILVGFVNAAAVARLHRLCAARCTTGGSHYLPLPSRFWFYLTRATGSLPPFFFPTLPMRFPIRATTSTLQFDWLVLCHFGHFWFSSFCVAMFLPATPATIFLCFLPTPTIWFHFARHFGAFCIPFPHLPIPSFNFAMATACAHHHHLWIFVEPFTRLLPLPSYHFSPSTTTPPPVSSIHAQQPPHLAFSVLHYRTFIVGSVRT